MSESQSAKDAKNSAHYTQAYTVWKDGTFQLWGAMDAFYAQTDPDWLCTCPIPIIEPDVKPATQSLGENGT